ncbi:MAG: glycine zipper 2TM domain-containing protein [Magnetococcales bacterium]|nr:glycine zipper 2TM domain-containing protein [Magnetococcales bacterium]
MNRSFVPFWKAVIVLLVVALAGSGCAPQNKAQSGAGVGALGGALIGSLLGPGKNREQNALIGAAIGGMAGYIFGNEMDKEDQMRLKDVYETGRSNESVSWVNPDSQAAYEVTPRSATQSPDGQLCRDAEIRAVIDGREETVTQRACRNYRGEWEIM